MTFKVRLYSNIPIFYARFESYFSSSAEKKPHKNHKKNCIFLLLFFIYFQGPVFDSISVKTNNFVLLSKWGCDGSSGQSCYKQKAEECGFTDSNIFLTSLVPLQLFYEENNEKTIFWQNPDPSPTKFCRPIRFAFVKETTEISDEEVSRVKREIEELKETEVEIKGQI